MLIPPVAPAAQITRPLPLTPAAPAPSVPAPQPPAAGAGELLVDRAVPGEHIVVFAPEVGVAEQRELVRGLAPVSVEELPSVNGLLVRLDPATPPAIEALAATPGGKVRFTQPNYLHELRGVDPEQPRQYHLDNTGQTGGTPGADVKAPAAWRSSRGAGVVVAVADTNVDITHPDIAPNLWTNTREIAGNQVDDDANGYVDDVHGWNFGANSNRPQDGGQTHGTHVAGIIAAAGGNGIGGVGVAPEARIMPLAILTSRATTANAIKAFAYAVRNGADVISNSWGNNTYEPALAEAVRHATGAGLSVVVAAGNENWDTGVNGSYPDNYAGSFSVAASDAKDGKASYSNRGTLTIDVAAPGDKVLSTLPGSKYGTMSGTSMAAPVVSGLLALVKARYPHLSMREVEQRVLRSVQVGGSASVWSTLVASGGRVDADAALTPIATPGAPFPTDGAVAGSPVRIDWPTDVTDGQRFEVEVSTNPGARSTVAEDFERGTTARAFRSSGDRVWSINDAVSRTGARSFNVAGLGRGQQSRLELTETVTEPTELTFAYRGGKGAELSFFIDRELQAQPTSREDWQEFRTVLQPGTHTFTWLATSRSSQGSPVAVDGLRIGSVSDATWSPVGTTEPGSTGTFWTPTAPVEQAAVRVRADNGRFRGDWVQGDPFEVTRARAAGR